MEFSENQSPKNDSLFKEQCRLLDESFAWVDRIIRERPSERMPGAAYVEATTPEARESGKTGLVYVEQFEGDNRGITISEYDHSNSKKDTTEKYLLSFPFDASGEYQLLVGEAQPDSDQGLFRPATIAEIRRLEYVLEIAAFGNVAFDFEDFEKKFNQQP